MMLSGVSEFVCFSFTVKRGFIELFDASACFPLDSLGQARVITTEKQQQQSSPADLAHILIS